MFNLIYPVGSIYISVNSTNPSVLFGGTWEQIQDKFLLAAGTAYTAGDTGGSADAIVPYHNHSVAAASGAITGGSHSHGTGNSTYNRWATTNAAGVSDDPAAALSGSGYVYPRIGSDYAWASRTATSSETHTHDLPAHNTNYAGSSDNAIGANMPPYLAVYIWKRTL